MTLIVTCLMPEYAIQVSDRRLTKLDGSLYDDETNKAVFYLPGAVISYTGLARVNRVATDEWLVGALDPGLDLDQLCETLKVKAERHFGGVRREHRHVALVIACWVGRHPVRPSMALISNYYYQTATGSLEARSETTREFRAIYTIKREDQPFALFCAGQDLSPSQRKNLTRFVRRYLQNTTSAERSHVARGLCRYFAKFIRGISETNCRVGASLMQTVLPNPEMPEVANQPAQFLYLPSNKSSPISYAPNLVNSTMKITGLEIGSFTPGEGSKFLEALQKRRRP